MLGVGKCCSFELMLMDSIELWEVVGEDARPSVPEEAGGEVEEDIIAGHELCKW